MKKVFDSGFKEEDHPRAKSGNTAGQFVKKGTSGVGSLTRKVGEAGQKAKQVAQMGKEGTGELSGETKQLRRKIHSAFASYYIKKKEKNENIRRLGEEIAKAAKESEERKKAKGGNKEKKVMKHPIGEYTEQMKQKLKDLTEGPEKEKLKKAEFNRRLKKRAEARKAAGFEPGKKAVAGEKPANPAGGSEPGLKSGRGNSAFEKGEIETLKKFHGGGINRVYKGKLKDDGSGVFKFMKDEIDGRESGLQNIIRSYKTKLGADLIACPQVHREVLTSLIDEVVGLDMVPKTILRVHPVKGEASCQQFVEDLKVGRRPPARNKEGLIQAIKASIFDKIVGAPDRHGRNYGMAGNKVVLIDNGLNFVVNHGRAWNGDYAHQVFENFIDPYEQERIFDKHPEAKKEVDRQVNAVKSRKADIDKWFRQANLPEAEQQAFWERVERLSRYEWWRCGYR